MPDTPIRAQEQGQPDHYQVRIKGHLGPRWAGSFEGMTVIPDLDGDTVLTGPVVDQAALHGLLRKLRDLGLPLLSIVSAVAKPEDATDAR